MKILPSKEQVIPTIIISLGVMFLVNRINFLKQLVG